MKKGGGKRKGGSYERALCVKLSLWVSHGKRKDLFWRSAMSGGRATVGAKKGDDLGRQAGDISAVSPEGHALTDRFLIECKAYNNLQIDSFLLENKGKLAKFWAKAVKEASKHRRHPMLIAKQNFKPAIVITSFATLSATASPFLPSILIQRVSLQCEIHLLDTLLRAKFQVDNVPTDTHQEESPTGRRARLKLVRR